MSLRLKIPKLEDLCIEDVIYNIEHYASVFETCQPGSSLHFVYRVVQRIFSFKLPEILERIHRSGISCSVYNQTLLGRRISLSCLRFLLNKFTTQASVTLLRKVYLFRADNFLVALHQCKALRYLEMKNSRFDRSVFLSSIPQWKDLIKIDLLNSSCNDEIFMEILRNCPEIRELRVTGESITERALLNLCKNNNDPEEFRFCGEHGECCQFGKKLCRLRLYGTQVGVDGLASALQHLKSLKQLEDGTLFVESEFHSRLFFSTTCVYYSVGFLRTTYESRHLPHPQLQLKTLLIPLSVNFVTDNDLTLFRTLECCSMLEVLYVECPSVADYAMFGLSCFQHLRTLYLDFGRFPPLRLQTSRHFQHFLGTTGRQLETVSLSGVKVTLRMIKIVLQNCQNLTQFHVGYKKCFSRWKAFTVVLPSYDDTSEEDVNLFATARNLQNVQFHCVLFSSERVERFLGDFLIESVNIKFLAISGSLLESSFLRRFLTANKLSKLEEISVGYADVEDVSLKPLLEHSTSLRKITCSSLCPHATTFLRKHREIARRNNLQVIIEQVTH